MAGIREYYWRADMAKITKHPIYHSSFGFKQGDTWYLIGHLNRRSGWQDYMRILCFTANLIEPLFRLWLKVKKWLRT